MATHILIIVSLGGFGNLLISKLATHCHTQD